MPAFKALSYGDKLRVGRYVSRGEAPDDPRMAAAAVELAESYQRQSRPMAAFLRWYPAIFIVVAGCGFVLNTMDGDRLLQVAYALMTLMIIPHLMFNPATRPKNMARSLEASRRIAASDG